MKQTGGRPYTISFRVDRKIDDIIRLADFPVYDLVEAGLLSMARNPDTKNNQLVDGAIRYVEKKIEYYSENLKELEKLRDAPAVEEPVKAAVEPKPRCDILARGNKTNALYWLTEHIEGNYPEVFHKVSDTEDGGDEYPKIYSADDIPECEA